MNEGGRPVRDCAAREFPRIMFRSVEALEEIAEMILTLCNARRWPVGVVKSGDLWLCGKNPPSDDENRRRMYIEFLRPAAHFMAA